jgi:protease I
MAKVLFIIAQLDFRDEELLVPKDILEKSAHTCDIASISTETAHGMLGASVEPDISVGDADAIDYAAVVIVGGSGCPSLMRDPDVLKLVIDACDKGLIVAAICLGGIVLAKAGVLKDKKATVYKTPDSQKVYKDNGVIFLDLPLVVDGKFVTAQGPHVAGDFGKKLAELLR